MENEKKTSYIKLPASIFNLTDKPIASVGFGKEFIVLVYLYMLAQINHSATVKTKLQTIANRCGISAKENVIRLIDKLISKGYISKEKNLSIFSHLQTSNDYIICDPSPEKYFLMPAYLLNEVAKATVNTRYNAGKILYLVSYFSYCKGKGEDCYPDYADICLATGFGRGTISKYLTFLSEHNIVVRVKYLRKRGGNGQNHYFFMHSLEMALGTVAATGLKLLMEAKRAMYEDLRYYRAVIAGMISLFTAMAESASEPDSAPVAPIVLSEAKEKRAHKGCAPFGFVCTIRKIINKAADCCGNLLKKAKNSLIFRLTQFKA